MRARNWFVAAITVMAAVLSPVHEDVSAQAAPGMMISEFRFRGPAGANDEFIELYNAGPDPINIGGWLIRVSNNNVPPGVGTRLTITAGTVVNPGCYYLITNNATGGYNPALNGGVTGNQTYNTGFADDGGMALTLPLPPAPLPPNPTIIDQVGHGANGAFGEGTRLPTLLTNVNRGLERRPGGLDGHVDTNDNAADFQHIVPPNPQNSSSACLATAFKFPHEIQGDGAVSPFAGTTQTVRGVVTARAGNGFYLQTASGDEDADASTSEGLFVFTGAVVPAAAEVGRLVSVTGSVNEFVPVEDPGSPSVTRLSSVTTVTDLGASTVPAAHNLTPADLSEAGALDQLERFEGMRVSASLSAVSPTLLDGTFYAVLSGQARPFREPGVEAGYPVPACAAGSSCNVPVFDGNPERLRVDSDAFGTAALVVSTHAAMNVTGVLTFEARTYTVLPQATLLTSTGMGTSAAPAAPADHYTVASLNLNRFLDSSDDTRLARASLMIRDAMGAPDIVGLQEVESLTVLQTLAARIDTDAAAAGQPAPAYTALHVDHVNADGLDVAFLVKSGRVSVLSLDPVSADAATEHPSLMLRALVSGPATSLPQAVTVIANQLPAPGDHARRQVEAEALANYIQGRQIADPSEAIVSVGGYQALGFNDGFVDVVGTVRGASAPADQVSLWSADVVSPALVNLADLVPAEERYAAVVNGSAQSQDHVLMSANLGSQFVDLVHARVNADFPDPLAGNRDPLVAYFVFPPDVDAPVFAPVADRVEEATSADGAAVVFDTPAATDNLDPTVTVTCDPLSGSTFPLGNSGVTCSAQDVAGNGSSTSFTVTVQDTTAPELTVPGDVNEEATSPAGRVVNFVATATDVVTVSPAVTCMPASGSTFPLGETTVNCTATDAAGNSASGSFEVTIAAPVVGRMTGVGGIETGHVEVKFNFDVRESSDYTQGGSLSLQVRYESHERNLAGTVTNVRFSDAPGYDPGNHPQSGVDTVVFSGTGSWNGVAGYTFEVTASDRGEPGPGHDRFAVVVRAPGGDTVLSKSGALSNGNIKSVGDDSLMLAEKMRQLKLKLDREAEARARAFVRALLRAAGR